MCFVCGDSMEQTRVLLASKIVRLLPKEDDTDLEAVLERVINGHAAMIGRVSQETSTQVMNCSALRENLARGIQKTLPTISLEDRFRLALAAGAVRIED